MFLCFCVLFVFGVLVLFRCVLWCLLCDSVEDYVSVLTPWPTIEPPQKQDFLHTLLGTKDSAPGADGIRTLHGDYHLKTVVQSWKILWKGC